MTPTEIANSIRSEFRAAIELNQPAITNKVQYENVRFEPPEDDTWASFHIEFGERFQAEFGQQRTYRAPGIMFVTLFAPHNSGTSVIGGVVDAIVSHFQGVTRDGILFFAPSVSNIGTQRGEPWYAVQVTAPFHQDRFDTQS